VTPRVTSVSCHVTSSIWNWSAANNESLLTTWINLTCSHLQYASRRHTGSLLVSHAIIAAPRACGDHTSGAAAAGYMQPCIAWHADVDWRMSVYSIHTSELVFIAHYSRYGPDIPSQCVVSLRPPNACWKLTALAGACRRPSRSRLGLYMHADHPPGRHLQVGATAMPLADVAEPIDNIDVGRVVDGSA